jgi:hypothetical protein
VKWSLLVSFLLMIILQLCSLIQVLHIPLWVLLLHLSISW